MAKKRSNPRTVVEPAWPIDTTKKVLLPWDGSKQALKAVLRKVLDARQITLTELARRVDVRLTHLSRWLKGKEGDQDRLPLGVLSRIAKQLGCLVVIALVEARHDEDGAIHFPTPRLLREFYIGMAWSVNSSEGPAAVARNMARVWEAKSWSMYCEDPRRNVLEWVGGGPKLVHKELMYGPSYVSELPIQVVQEVEMRQRSPAPNPRQEQTKFLEFDWESPSPSAGHRSAFAQREKVGYCIGIPVQGEGMRTTVLFLNFENRPEAAARDPHVVATATNELRGLVQEAWPTPAPSGTMQRGELQFGMVLDVLSNAFQCESGESLDGDTQEALKRSCESLWPGKDKSCTVYALTKSVKYLDKLQVEFRGGLEPDNMVKRAAASGENFYVTELSQDEVRARFDPDNRIPPGQVQKLVVPIRCEEFLDIRNALKVAERRAETITERVLQSQAPRQFQSWGVLSVDTDERIFSPANSLELSVLAHLVAGALHIRKEARADRQAQDFYSSLYQAIHATIRDLRNLEPKQQHGETGGNVASRKPRTHDALMVSDPLDALCRTVVEKRLFGSVERCAIFPYDHVHGEFRKGAGGSYIDPIWIQGLKPPLAQILLDNEGKVKYLEPRKGGNSERMLGVLDEYHVISDARGHPRVSPVTKMMGTASLIGCSCRIGCSFRSDAVIWLGSRKGFALNCLEENECEMLVRLRVLAHVAAMFCVAIRWWGRGADWPIT